MQSLPLFIISIGKMDPGLLLGNMSSQISNSREMYCPVIHPKTITVGVIKRAS